jgi:hypothetical protein
MKKILLLPGTKWQIHLAKKIKEKGYKLYVIDPAQDAPCKKCADIFLQADIFDDRKIDQFIQSNPIDAVISDECDIATVVIARIGQKFHLPSIGLEMAGFYTNKRRMRDFCKEIKLKYPKYKMCRTKKEAYDFYREWNCTMIMKPIDCNASKGVHTIHSEREIDTYFLETLSYSRTENGVLLEQYIHGTEFTIDGIKTPSKHYTLAISEKKHFKHNDNIADELLFSHYNAKYDYEQLKAINDTYILKSQLPFGFTHAEYKYENGEFFLIEIAARGGGNRISSVITQYMSEYDTYNYLIDSAMGKFVDYDFSIQKQFWERAAVLKFFHTPYGGGRVKKIYGLDYLDAESDIQEYSLNFQAGDTIEDCVSDSARIGYYIACCENMEHLKAVMNNVREKFRIELE